MLRRRRNGKLLMKDYGHYDRYGRGEINYSDEGDSFRLRGTTSPSPFRRLRKNRDPYYRENLTRQTSYTNVGTKPRIRGRVPKSNISHTRVRRRCCGN